MVVPVPVPAPAPPPPDKTIAAGRKAPSLLQAEVGPGMHVLPALHPQEGGGFWAPMERAKVGRSGFRLNILLEESSLGLGGSNEIC